MIPAISKLRVRLAQFLVLLARSILRPVCHRYWTADWEFKHLTRTAERLDDLVVRIDEAEGHDAADS